MSTTQYAAIDLGAESGRVILGTLDAHRLTLAEYHRFPTGGQHHPDGSYRWDIARISAEIYTGLRKIAAEKIPLRSISTDSWGVDYVWLDADGKLLAQPRHYRDPRNETAFARLLKKVPREAIFAETGIQFLSLNTLYQLEADAHDHAIPANAAGFLLIADYINYQLSGKFLVEESNASTTQLYKPATRAWSAPLAAAIGVPIRLFPIIVGSARILSPALTPSAVAATGLPAQIPVVSSCSHDTSCAVFATPATGHDWAYLSSGTWSLLGAELYYKTILNADALAANFTNEIGYHNTTRFLKNIIGMWILQECRRDWAASGENYTYDELQRLATAAAPHRSLIHPNDPRFAVPGDMPQKIAAYCRETNQPLPGNPGEIVRTVLESLALLYNQTLDRLDQLTGQTTRRLHIVGGGSQNTLLNQFTADATGRTVIAGPVEATATGNILLQALALGDIPDHATARRIVSESFPLLTYTPGDAPHWQAARERFKQLA